MDTPRYSNILDELFSEMGFCVHERSQHEVYSETWRHCATINCVIKLQV